MTPKREEILRLYVTSTAGQLADWMTSLGHDLTRTAARLKVDPFKRHAVNGLGVLQGRAARIDNACGRLDALLQVWEDFSTEPVDDAELRDRLERAEDALTYIRSAARLSNSALGKRIFDEASRGLTDPAQEEDPPSG